MKILDNINSLWGNDLKQALKPGAKLKMAASCFSIYAFEALKKELEKIDSLEFIFTAPAFVPNEVTDKVSKERREFFIPKQQRERYLYGREAEKLENRIKNEKQFNRRVELNRSLNALKQKIEKLKL